MGEHRPGRTTARTARRARPGHQAATAVLPLVLLALLLPLVGRAEAETPVDVPRTDGFSDVPPSHSFYAEIMWMAEEGFVDGFPDGTFRPTAGVTRQALVQILWRMTGSPEGPFAPEFFTDVTPTHPFYTAIRWASHNDVARGFPDGTFRGGNLISRQALGAVLHRLSGIEGSYADTNFIDVPEGSAFDENIDWWVSSGQADGYTNGEFRPLAPVTRQGAAAFLERFNDMMGGYWPYEDHHSHVCDEEPTPEQNAVADQLIIDSEAAVAELFPTKAAAIAAGYRVTAPPFAGVGSHMVNDVYSKDGIVLDPTKPESLVLHANETDVAAAMFVREYVGPGPVWPPEPGGCRTLWHGHDNLCYSGPLGSPGAHVTWIADIGGCSGSTMVRITPEMLHVWRAEFWDGDPFDGIET